MSSLVLPREGSRRELTTAERGSHFVVALLPGRHACLAGEWCFFKCFTSWLYQSNHVKSTRVKVYFQRSVWAALGRMFMMLCVRRVQSGYTVCREARDVTGQVNCLYSCRFIRLNYLRNCEANGIKKSGFWFTFILFVSSTNSG